MRAKSFGALLSPLVNGLAHLRCAAAELPAGPWRDRINGATMLNQSKTLPSRLARKGESFSRLASLGALIHSISSKAPPGVTGPFIRKYIFPGGYSPSLSETFEAIEKSGLWPLDNEIWRVHYAKTLAEWRRRFEAIRPQAVEMYDEKFARMWEIYLSSCECVFSHGASLVFQIQLGRERDGVPFSRDYLAENKAKLRENEAEIVERLAASARQALGG